jgi:hypothetical protein
LTQFVVDLTEQLKTQIISASDNNTVVALLGVGSLFGLARVSVVVEGLKDVIKGRLLVLSGRTSPENPPTDCSMRVMAGTIWPFL